MEPAGFDVDEPIEFWTLLDEDRALLVGKRGATGLGFAVLLKHYSRYGRFPRGRSELPDEVVAFVARQIGVAAADLGFYEWIGSTNRVPPRSGPGSSWLSPGDRSGPGDADGLAVGSRRVRGA